jgi:hypothetical protein
LAASHDIRFDVPEPRRVAIVRRRRSETLSDSLSGRRGLDWRQRFDGLKCGAPHFRKMRQVWRVSQAN